MKVPCSCIGIPTLMEREDTPQAGSLLPVGLGPIFNRHTAKTRICITNSRISIRVIMTKF